jgi:hypothetical protein
VEADRTGIDAALIERLFAKEQGSFFLARSREYAERVVRIARSRPRGGKNH